MTNIFKVNDVTHHHWYVFDISSASTNTTVVDFLIKCKGIDTNGNRLTFDRRYLYRFKRCIHEPIDPTIEGLTHESICISSSPYEYAIQKHTIPVHAKLAWLKRFKIMNVPSDGNCYFHAIVQSLYFRFYDKLNAWNTTEDFDSSFDFQMHQPPTLPRFITKDALLRDQAPDQLRLLIGYYMVMFYGFWDKDIEASKYIEHYFDARKEEHLVHINSKSPDSLFKEITIDTSFFTDSLTTPDFKDVPDQLLEGLYDTVHGKPYHRSRNQWGGDQIITQFVNALFDVTVIQYDDDTINANFDKHGIDPLPDTDCIILYRKDDHYYWFQPQSETIEQDTTASIATT